MPTCTVEKFTVSKTDLEKFDNLLKTGELDIAIVSPRMNTKAKTSLKFKYGIVILD